MAEEKRLNLSKVESRKLIDAVTTLYIKQNRLKEVQEKYLKIKEELTRDISNFYFTKGIDGALSFPAEVPDQVGKVNLVVRKIQRVDVKFDADKVEKALGKELSKKTIVKSYEVANIIGLLEYVKELGADPKVIKGFLTVHKTVDQKMLDNLEKLGLIDSNQLKGCYTVNKQEPYFTIKEGKKGEGS
jgi:hypothetical protein